MDDAEERAIAAEMLAMAINDEIDREILRDLGMLIESTPVPRVPFFVGKHDWRREGF